MADQSERLLRGAMVVHARMLLLAGLVIAAGVVTPIVAAAQSATPAPASSGGTPSTAAVVTSTNDPLSVLVSDGMQHLEYDLIVTNTYHAPVRQTHTDVLVPDGTQPQRLEGEAPVTATQPILRSQPQQEIPASGTVAVVVDVDVPPELAIEGLTHTIAYGVPPDAPDLALIGCRDWRAGPLGRAHGVGRDRAAALGRHLAGAQRLCSAASVHRFERIAAGGTAIAKAKMFAIDWMQL